jgi:hypothetical protein
MPLTTTIPPSPRSHRPASFCAPTSRQRGSQSLRPSVPPLSGPPLSGPHPSGPHLLPLRSSTPWVGILSVSIPASELADGRRDGEPRVINPAPPPDFLAGFLDLLHRQHNHRMSAAPIAGGVGRVRIAHARRPRLGPSQTDVKLSPRAKQSGGGGRGGEAAWSQWAMQTRYMCVSGKHCLRVREAGMRHAA